MRIYETAYKTRGTRQFDENHTEVLVNRVEGDRVHYREITVWHYSWPHTDGVNKSATRQQFEATYEEIDIPLV